MNEGLTKKLVDRFGFYKMDRPLTESLMGFGFEVGDGWFNIIWNLSERLESFLAKIPGTPVTQKNPFEPVQVKEKFGGLRFYVNWATDEMYDAIAEAESRSLHICEVCGCPGKQRGGGWIVTLCDIHSKKDGGV